MFTYKESNGSFEVRFKGQYVGLISQNPNDERVMNPGMWGFSFHDRRGGLCSTSPEENVKTFEDAKAMLEDVFLADLQA